MKLFIQLYIELDIGLFISTNILHLRFNVFEVKDHIYLPGYV